MEAAVQMMLGSAAIPSWVQERDEGRGVSDEGRGVSGDTARGN